MSRFDYIAFDDLTKVKQYIFKDAAQRIERAALELDEAVSDFDELIVTELMTTLGHDANAHLARLRLDGMLGHDTDGEPRTIDDLLTGLEEAYMWVGKALRNMQLERNKKPQDERATT